MTQLHRTHVAYDACGNSQDFLCSPNPIFVLVGVAHIIGKEVFGNEIVLRDMVTYFYIANEGMSIIENAAKANVPIPEGLKNLFEKLHTDNAQKKQ